MITPLTSAISKIFKSHRVTRHPSLTPVDHAIAQCEKLFFEKHVEICIQRTTHSTADKADFSMTYEDVKTREATSRRQLTEQISMLQTGDELRRKIRSTKRTARSHSMTAEELERSLRDSLADKDTYLDFGFKVVCKWCPASEARKKSTRDVDPLAGVDQAEQGDGQEPRKIDSEALQQGDEPPSVERGELDLFQVPGENVHKNERSTGAMKWMTHADTVKETTSVAPFSVAAGAVPLNLEDRVSISKQAAPPWEVGRQRCNRKQRSRDFGADESDKENIPPNQGKGHHSKKKRTSGLHACGFQNSKQRQGPRRRLGNGDQDDVEHVPPRQSKETVRDESRRLQHQTGQGRVLQEADVLNDVLLDREELDRDWMAEPPNEFSEDINNLLSRLERKLADDYHGDHYQQQDRVNLNQTDDSRTDQSTCGSPSLLLRESVPDSLKQDRPQCENDQASDNGNETNVDTDEDFVDDGHELDTDDRDDQDPGRDELGWQDGGRRGERDLWFLHESTVAHAGSSESSWGDYEETQDASMESFAGSDWSRTQWSRASLMEVSSHTSDDDVFLVSQEVHPLAAASVCALPFEAAIVQTEPIEFDIERGQPIAAKVNEKRGSTKLKVTSDGNDRVRSGTALDSGDKATSATHVQPAPMAAGKVFIFPETSMSLMDDCDQPTILEGEDDQEQLPTNGDKRYAESTKEPGQPAKHGDTRHRLKDEIPLRDVLTTESGDTAPASSATKQTLHGRENARKTENERAGGKPQTSQNDRAIDDMETLDENAMTTVSPQGLVEDHDEKKRTWMRDDEGMDESERAEETVTTSTPRQLDNKLTRNEAKAADGRQETTENNQQMESSMTFDELFVKYFISPKQEDCQDADANADAPREDRTLFAGASEKTNSPSATKETDLVQSQEAQEAHDTCIPMTIEENQNTFGTCAEPADIIVTTSQITNNKETAVLTLRVPSAANQNVTKQLEESGHQAAGHVQMPDSKEEEGSQQDVTHGRNPDPQETKQDQNVVLVQIRDPDTRLQAAEDVLALNLETISEQLLNELLNLEPKETPRSPRYLDPDDKDNDDVDGNDDEDTQEPFTVVVEIGNDTLEDIIQAVEEEEDRIDLAAIWGEEVLEHLDEPAQPVEVVEKIREQDAAQEQFRQGLENSSQHSEFERDNPRDHGGTTPQEGLMGDNGPPVPNEVAAFHAYEDEEQSVFSGGDDQLVDEGKSSSESPKARIETGPGLLAHVNNPVEGYFQGPKAFHEHIKAISGDNIQTSDAEDLYEKPENARVTGNELSGKNTTLAHTEDVSETTAVGDVKLYNELIHGTKATHVPDVKDGEDPDDSQQKVELEGTANTCREASAEYGPHESRKPRAPLRLSSRSPPTQDHSQRDETCESVDGGTRADSVEPQEAEFLKSKQVEETGALSKDASAVILSTSSLLQLEGETEKSKNNAEKSSLSVAKGQEEETGMAAKKESNQDRQTGEQRDPKRKTQLPVFRPQNKPQASDTYEQNSENVAKSSSANVLLRKSELSSIVKQARSSDERSTIPNPQLDGNLASEKTEDPAEQTLSRRRRSRTEKHCKRTASFSLGTKNAAKPTDDQHDIRTSARPCVQHDETMPSDQWQQLVQTTNYRRSESNHSLKNGSKRSSAEETRKGTGVGASESQVEKSRFLVQAEDTKNKHKISFDNREKKDLTFCTSESRKEQDVKYVETSEKQNPKDTSGLVTSGAQIIMVTPPASSADSQETTDARFNTSEKAEIRNKHRDASNIHETKDTNVLSRETNEPRDKRVRISAAGRTDEDPSPIDMQTTRHKVDGTAETQPIKDQCLPASEIQTGAYGASDETERRLNAKEAQKRNKRRSASETQDKQTSTVTAPGETETCLSTQQVPMRDTRRRSSLTQKETLSSALEAQKKDLRPSTLEAQRNVKRPSTLEAKKDRRPRSLEAQTKDTRFIISDARASSSEVQRDTDRSISEAQMKNIRLSTPEANIKDNLQSISEAQKKNTRPDTSEGPQNDNRQLSTLGAHKKSKLPSLSGQRKDTSQSISDAQKNDTQLSTLEACRMFGKRPNTSDAHEKNTHQSTSEIQKGKREITSESQKDERTSTSESQMGKRASTSESQKDKRASTSESQKDKRSSTSETQKDKRASASRPQKLEKSCNSAHVQTGEKKLPNTAENPKDQSLISAEKREEQAQHPGALDTRQKTHVDLNFSKTKANGERSADASMTADTPFKHPGIGKTYQSKSKIPNCLHRTKAQDEHHRTLHQQEKQDQIFGVKATVGQTSASRKGGLSTSSKSDHWKEANQALAVDAIVVKRKGSGTSEEAPGTARKESLQSVEAKPKAVVEQNEAQAKERSLQDLALSEKGSSHETQTPEENGDSPCDSYLSKSQYLTKDDTHDESLLSLSRYLVQDRVDQWSERRDEGEHVVQKTDEDVRKNMQPSQTSESNRKGTKTDQPPKHIHADTKAGELNGKIADPSRPTEKGSGEVRFAETARTDTKPNESNGNVSSLTIGPHERADIFDQTSESGCEGVELDDAHDNEQELQEEGPRIMKSSKVRQSTHSPLYMTNNLQSQSSDNVDQLNPVDRTNDGSVVGEGQVRRSSDATENIVTDQYDDDVKKYCVTQTSREDSSAATDAEAPRATAEVTQTTGDGFTSEMCAASYRPDLEEDSLGLETPKSSADQRKQSKKRHKKMIALSMRQYVSTGGLATAHTASRLSDTDSTTEVMSKKKHHVKVKRDFHGGDEIKYSVPQSKTLKKRSPFRLATKKKKAKPGDSDESTGCGASDSSSTISLKREDSTDEEKTHGRKNKTGASPLQKLKQALRHNGKKSREVGSPKSNPKEKLGEEGEKKAIAKLEGTLEEIADKTSTEKETTPTKPNDGAGAESPMTSWKYRILECVRSEERKRSENDLSFLELASEGTSGNDSHTHEEPSEPPDVDKPSEEPPCHNVDGIVPGEKPPSHINGKIFLVPPEKPRRRRERKTKREFPFGPKVDGDRQKTQEPAKPIGDGSSTPEEDLFLSKEKMSTQRLEKGLQHISSDVNPETINERSILAEPASRAHDEDEASDDGSQSGHTDKTLDVDRTKALDKSAGAQTKVTDSFRGKKSLFDRIFGTKQNKVEK